MVFGWRKKPQGFDWNAYVRTTIKLRRDQRHARLDDIKQNVADHARQAGAVAVKGVKVGAAGAGARLKSGFGTGLSALRRALEPVGAAIETGGLWIYLQLARPGFALPLILCGAISLVSGLYGAVFSAEGTGQTSPAVAVAGLGMLIASMPSVLTGFGFDVADADGFAARLVQRLAVPLAAVVLVGGGGWLFGNGYAPSGLNGAPAWIGSVVGGLSSQPPVEGKATVLSGDMFRLNGAVYKLAGVKSPDPQQVCERDAGAKKWKCGQSALSALEKFVGGRTVRCVGYRPADPVGQIEAKCEVAGKDVAEAQVRGGHVFATSQLLGGYSGLEQEARTQGRGIWSSKIERPVDYRARIWEMAKRAAPDGCPIKGQMTNSGKTYVLPWSPEYSRTAIKTTKGDRWFCSEDEALSAGWKAAGRT